MTALLASAWAYLCAVLAWIQANPTIAWPIITAIVTIALKPRTPEAYAKLASRNPVWLFARLAAVLQLIGALGLDPVKAMAALRKLPGGNTKPPPPPAGPSVLPVLLVVGLLGLGSSGCALFTKGNARTLIDIAQTACIIAHQDLPDSDVAKVCDITDPLLGPMREILTSSRATSAKAAADASARAGAARCVASP